nr:MAG TPA: hypothetical protein [Caudoviricetes sp.]
MLSVLLFLFTELSNIVNTRVKKEVINKIKLI